MKKSLKIFISLLAVFFIAQICFAPTTINSDIPNTINPERPESNPDEVQKDERARKIMILTMVGLGIIGVIGAAVVIVYILYFWDPFPNAGLNN